MSLCRRCGACCIIPSISSPLPGLPEGKPAFMRCPHLSPQNLCTLFESHLRPKVCSRYSPGSDCGSSFEEASDFLLKLEKATGRGTHS